MTYEGLFIYHERLPEDRVEGITAQVRAEIEKHGGKVLEVRSMGRRAFARPMQKCEAGWFVSVFFEITADKVVALAPRFHLMEDVFRTQIGKLPKGIPPPPAPREDRPPRDDHDYRAPHDRYSR